MVGRNLRLQGSIYLAKSQQNMSLGNRPVQTQNMLSNPQQINEPFLEKINVLHIWENKDAE